MAELNFGLLTPPGSENIGNAFVRGQDQARAAQMQDMQMQQSMRQGQREELQYKKMQAEEDNLNKFYSSVAENGGPKDPIAMEDQMIGSKVPQYVQLGYTLKTKRLALEQDRKRYAEANAPSPALGGVAPMAPSPGSFGAEVATRKAELFGPAPDRTNMMLGAAVAPADVNALPATVAPQGGTPLDALRARINANLALGTEQGNKTAENLQKQLTEATKLYPLGNVLMSGTGAIVGTAPATPSEFEKLLKDSGLSQEEQRAARVAKIGKDSTTISEFSTVLAQLGKTKDPSERRQLQNRLTYLSTHQPGTSLTVKLPAIEGKYGAEFGELAAKADDKLLGAARSAPKIAENANETLRLLTLPTITGSGADIRLALAKAYNLLGDTDQQSIVNTENLIKSTGEATLAAIKNSGLGTGQGFTNNDLKFLQGVAGGTIALQAESIARFARVQHDAAVKIAAMWETRKKNIPKSALEGTGIDKEIISIEPIRGQAKYSVTAPDGKTYPFSSPEKAAEFKRQIGIK